MFRHAHGAGLDWWDLAEVGFASLSSATASSTIFPCPAAIPRATK